MVRVSSVVPLLSILIGFSLICCNGAEDAPSQGDSSPGGAPGVGGDFGSGGADASSDCPAESRGFASEVIDYEFGGGQTFGQDNFPEAVLGGPQGKGCCSGSFHVVSLGDGGWVELGFTERSIVDGEGPDFIVFENPFALGGEKGAVFFELARVSVSADGENWVEFSCDPEKPSESNCAGYFPVLANVETGTGDAFDAQLAGGDAFDLADVGLKSARYVRIVDILDDDAVFDLDAVSLVHGRCD